MAAGATELRVRPAELAFVVRGNPLSQNRAWTIITWKPKKGSAAHPHSSLKLTKEGAEFKLEVARIASLAKPPEWDIDNEYEVTAVYYFDSRRPDCDGPGKLVLDALEAILYRRDSQVWRFTQQKERDPEQPRAEITVRLRMPWKPQQRPLL